MTSPSFTAMLKKIRAKAHASKFYQYILEEYYYRLGLEEALTKIKRIFIDFPSSN
jgi:hypothetical protein